MRRRKLSLPTDRPRLAVQTFRGASLSTPLPDGLAARPRTLSQHQGVTLFMTLLAAFGALLSRYSEQSDLMIGTPIANRTRGELEGLIGFFVNTLALASTFQAIHHLLHYSSTCSAVATEAYAHQDLPFEMLVARLAPERHLSQAPLFQVMFALENLAKEALPQ
jgi:non-ribosomal peptide synthetase component F